MNILKRRNRVRRRRLKRIQVNWKDIGLRHVRIRKWWVLRYRQRMRKCLRV